MDIEERMAKAETDIAALKETQGSLLQGQAELRTTIERGLAEQRDAIRDLRDTMECGFREQREATERCAIELREEMARAATEQRAATADLRTSMEQGFAEQRRALAEERAAREASIAELRREMQRGFRWIFSALLSILALVVGIIARLAGAF